MPGGLSSRSCQDDSNTHQAPHIFNFTHRHVCKPYFPPFVTSSYNGHIIMQKILSPNSKVLWSFTISTLLKTPLHRILPMKSYQIKLIDYKLTKRKQILIE